MRLAFVPPGSTQNLVASLSFHRARTNGWFKKLHLSSQPQWQCGPNSHLSRAIKVLFCCDCSQPLLAHRDEQVRLEFSVAIGGAADMDARAASLRPARMTRCGSRVSKFAVLHKITRFASMCASA